MNNAWNSPRFILLAWSFDGDGKGAGSGVGGTTGGLGCSGYGYVVVPSITSELAAAAAAFENCVEMWLKIWVEMLSVRLKVLRRRSSEDVDVEELGAGAAPPLGGGTETEALGERESDWESSLLSRRTSRSSVLMVNHSIRYTSRDTQRDHMN